MLAIALYTLMVAKELFVHPFIQDVVIKNLVCVRFYTAIKDKGDTSGAPSMKDSSPRPKPCKRICVCVSKVDGGRHTGPPRGMQTGCSMLGDLSYIFSLRQS